MAVDALLGLVVAWAWLGCFAMLRLRSSLDRLHVVTFVNVAAVPLALAGVVEDGITTRSLKMLALAVILLVAGAASSHAAGRAILLREGRDA